MRAVSRSFDQVGRGAQSAWSANLRKSRAVIDAVIAGERERRVLDAVRLFERTAHEQLPYGLPKGWRWGWTPGPGPLHGGYDEYQKVLPIDKRHALLLSRTVRHRAPTRLSFASHGPSYHEMQEYGWLELTPDSNTEELWLQVHPPAVDVPPGHAQLVRSFFGVAQVLVNKYRRKQRLRA